MMERILVVDDEQSVAFTLAALLEHAGYQTLTAHSLDDALRRLERDRFDAVLVDLMLGDDDGLLVLARLRDYAPDTVAIVLTGFGTLASATRAIQLGVSEYLTKPCPVDELKTAIQRGLERRRAIVGARREREEERARLLAAERQARLKAEAAERKQAFLAEASKLLATALDETEILATLVRLAVPALGDWCTVDVLDDDGQLRREAAACADPAKEALTREFLASYPPDLSEEGGVARVIRDGRSAFFPEISDALLRKTARDQREYEILHALGVRSAIMVPLIARDRILGALNLVGAGPERRYDEADHRLAEDLARRVALAIDNARSLVAQRAAIRLRDEFLSIAAHELKTPLTSLRASVQLLLRLADRTGTIDPGRLRNGLTVVDEQSIKLARLVNQLLDVSRLEAGRLVLDTVETDVVTLVHAVSAAARARTDAHALSVRAAGPIIVAVDPLRLEQVVSNLLDNAIKYSPEGGAIEVAVTGPSPDQVEIAVTDHGIGISPEHRAKIFDRFFRAHEGASYGGMGLGLYVSRQIVELHGGTITVDFPDDGGTRFVVHIPAVAPPTTLGSPGGT